MATQKIQLTRKTLSCLFWMPILELGNFEDEHRCSSQIVSHSKNQHACINAFSKIILPGGHLVFSITHPWFWPTYWGYDKYDWFKYDEEIAIEAPFRVSSDKDVIGITTHFHRPISHYLSELHNFGFEIDRLIEPMPRKEIELKYPNLWEFPRFIVIKCIRK